MKSWGEVVEEVRAVSEHRREQEETEAKLAAGVMVACPCCGKALRLIDRQTQQDRFILLPWASGFQASENQ